MRPVHCAFAAIVIAAASAAQAALAPSTFTFGNAMTSTGNVAWNAGNEASNYGNSESWNSTGTAVHVTVTAWASTGAMSVGGTTGYDRLIQNAFVDRIGHFELGVTSRPFNATQTSAANAELNSSGNPNGANSQHAMDNQGAYESLMFSFASAVALKDVSIGFPSVGVTNPDSDATVLVYTGIGDPTAGFSTRTYAQLLTSGWQVAGNLSNLSTTGTGSLSPSVAASKYWMVGAYMNIGSAANDALYTVGNDNIKLSAIRVQAVPEPDSIVLFGIAGAALFVGHRRKVRKG